MQLRPGAGLAKRRKLKALACLQAPVSAPELKIAGNAERVVGKPAEKWRNRKSAVVLILKTVYFLANHRFVGCVSPPSRTSESAAEATDMYAPGTIKAQRSIVLSIFALPLRLRKRQREHVRKHRTR
jgi:hypothetical protein